MGKDPRPAKGDLAGAESRLRLQSLFEAAPDPIFIVDSEGVIIEANGQASRVFGLGIDELIGQPIEMLVPEGRRGVHDRQRRAYQERPERRPMGRGLDLVAQRRDGSCFPVDITLGPFETPAGRYVVAIVRDVTESRQAEQELSRANEELEAFAYSVSHDLRTPLRAIQGIGRALEEDFSAQLPEEARGYLGRMVAAAGRMDGLILDLLAYSRLGRETHALAAVDLDPVWRDAREQLGERLQPCVRIAGPLGRVIGNRALLDQVAANLLGNAVKFARPGIQPAVEVSSSARQGRVRVSVRDNGIGLDPQHHERIFRIFERLHGIERYPGSGIGLALVKKAVLNMRGELGVDSRDGEGSLFWFELEAGE